MNIRRFLYVLIIIGAYAPVSGQESFYSYTLNNFRKAALFRETIDVANPDKARLNAVIFYLTNEIRAGKKLPELTYEKKLEESSELHSQSMVDNAFFSHLNPIAGLQTPNDRARYVGIKNPYMAENIIESFVLQYTPDKPVYPGGKGVFSYRRNGEPIKPHTYLSLGEDLIKGWMNSQEHKENILSKKAVQLGCGTAFYFNKEFNDMPTVVATQNFQLYETAIAEP